MFIYFFLKLILSISSSVALHINFNRSRNSFAKFAICLTSEVLPMYLIFCIQSQINALVDLLLPGMIYLSSAVGRPAILQSVE